MLIMFMIRSDRPTSSSLYTIMTLYLIKTTFHKTLSPQDAKKVQSAYCKQVVSDIARKQLGVLPREIIFNKGENGKPFLKNFPSFHFNISHTKNAVLIAVSDSPIGTDIEIIRPYDEKLLKVAKRFFLPKEFEYIAIEEGRQSNRFFEIWTRKEAYAKYLGTGLFTNVDVMSFDVLNPGFNGQIKTFFVEDYVLSVCGAKIVPPRLWNSPPGGIFF